MGFTGVFNFTPKKMELGFLSPPIFMEFFHLITGDGGHPQLRRFWFAEQRGACAGIGREDACVLWTHHLEVKELKFFPPLKSRKEKRGGAIGNTKEVPFMFLFLFKGNLTLATLI